MPAYWHKNIGGYHAAKLQRYQDIIDRYISKSDMKILDMLNTKYIIQKKENAEVFSNNPNAMGNAWFVDSLKIVDNANQEIDEIGKTNVRTTAIINKQFNDYVKSFDPLPLGDISLSSYAPDRLEYKYKSSEEGFIVFSEIWYGEKNGWKAYIDGKPADFIRANYVLRGMKVPAGDHKIVFEFKPRSYIMGENISLFSSLLILLLGAGYLFYIFYYKKKKA
ncbi:MAG: YfhO family protein [Saprospiraceae bacterium]|nr:YfhO family protein [Saprospiraceae bacterium]